MLFFSSRAIKEQLYQGKNVFQLSIDLAGLESLYLIAFQRLESLIINLALMIN